MPGSIGGVACDRVIGAYRAPAIRSEVWQIPGLNGYNIHLLGTGDAQSSFTVIGYGNETALQVWVNAIRALQGSIITIVNEQATTILGQFLVSVSDPKKRSANDLVSVTQRWELQIQTLSTI